MWANDAWTLVPLPVTPQEPRRVPKVDFWRRFTAAEQVALLGARKHIAEMSSADFALVENVGWWRLAVAFQTLDLISEWIEPDHPETLTYLEVLAEAGFITPDRIPDLLI